MPPRTFTPETFYASLCLFVALLITFVIPSVLTSAVTNGKSTVVQVVAVCGLLVAALTSAALAAFLLWSSRSARDRLRPHLSMLREPLALIGVRWCAGTSRRRWWYLAAALIVVLVYTFVRASAPVLRMLVEYFPTSEPGAQQQAWEAREAVYQLPFPGHITGVTMTANVIVEELIFRAPVIAASTIALRRLRRPGVVVPRWERAPLVAAVICVWAGISVYGFASGHEQFSALNFATTFLDGIVWGALAIWTRSLLPGVVGHSVNNVLAGGW
ncbi:CPBP family intramembrane glutamic endopeptidase [Rhodococcus sp. UFZ-B548]|uniref:CPBP family intramembrane glutamic endopeptidase n=1 Tax=Rhodococcus sp. UFZ-B548 TaxID=2742212 RepID=UPI0015F5B902|nr:CPBP family intramembrane glutamic endopeptidase [Rhodococcus sp. UFZ-B548]